MIHQVSTHVMTLSTRVRSLGDILLGLLHGFKLTALYALHVRWYWVWDLRNSKHHGISGYMAPILDQKLVRTRGVSYLIRWSEQADFPSCIQCIQSFLLTVSFSPICIMTESDDFECKQGYCILWMHTQVFFSLWLFWEVVSSQQSSWNKSEILFVFSPSKAQNKFCSSIWMCLVGFAPHLHSRNLAICPGPPSKDQRCNRCNDPR